MSEQSPQHIQIAEIAVDPAQLAAIVRAVGEGAVTRAQGRQVLAEHAETGASAAAIVDARGFRQISDAGAIGAAVDAVIAANPAAVADYRAGKAQAVGFLVGQVMKSTKGQANAAAAGAAIRERLDGAPEAATPGDGAPSGGAVEG